MEHLVETFLPTRSGNFMVRAYKSRFNDFPNMVLYTEDYNKNGITDVRIHSECMTGDLFGSIKCDCGEQLAYSLEWIQREGGVLIYLRQEGRGIGLINKLKAYNLQHKGLNTVDANLELGFHSDPRDYTEAIEILNAMEVKKIRLLTNNPSKVDSFNNTDIELIERLPIEMDPLTENHSYLETKKRVMGHFLSFANGKKQN